MEERAGLIWRGGEALRDLGRQLRASGGAIPHAAVPDAFHGSLRPYQAQGVDWLQFLRGAGLGGVLADDMGLGKTVQTLAHLLAENKAGRLTTPALVVAPTSLLPNWHAEAERWAAVCSGSGHCIPVCRDGVSTTPTRSRRIISAICPASCLTICRTNSIATLESGAKPTVA